MTGTKIDSYVTDTGDVLVPSARPALEVLVYVPGADCFARYPVITPMDGAFRVEKLPPGPYYVHTSSSGSFDLYVVTTSTALDLSRRIEGRPDVGSWSSSSSITLDLTGLEPIQSFDELWLYSTNMGLDQLLFVPDSDFGATMLSSLDPLYYGPLVDASRGDHVGLSQLGHRTSKDGASYRALVTMAVLPPFTLQRGMTTTVAGAFVSVPLDRTATITFDGAAYLKAVSASSRLTRSGSSCTVSSARLASLPWLAEYETGARAFTATMRFGVPFGSDLSWYCSSSMNEYSDAAGQQVFLFAGSAYAGGPFGDAPINVPPPLSAVTEVRIDNRDALQDVHSAGLTPHVAWSPPSQATVLGYSVAIFQVPGAGYPGVANYVAALNTTMTSFVVPPNTLQPGINYVFAITAFDGSRATDFVSGLVTP